MKRLGNEKFACGYSDCFKDPLPPVYDHVDLSLICDVLLQLYVGFGEDACFCF